LLEALSIGEQLAVKQKMPPEDLGMLITDFKSKDPDLSIVVFL
jgi:hypothetical protein